LTKPGREGKESRHRPLLQGVTVRIAVIGLGYVGLPLCVALARHHDVTGFDVNAERVAQLKSGIDRTGEVDSAVLGAAKMRITAAPNDIKGADVFIVTVPTPVDDENRPDLSLVLAACRTVGAAVAKGAIVVFESTVYPGVTEGICGPEIAKVSGLAPGRDFFLGYSPERINPGDRTHTLEKIVKVVAGQTPEVAATLARIYGGVTEAGVYVAKDIRTAEAAKVIENAQRDINIAFINEVAQIFQKLGLSMFDVLDAARTKWNFLDFRPGLVGGHCIGVDPFYLAHCAEQLGHHPEVILAGRRINDRMGTFVAERIARELGGDQGDKEILVLGLTFKENVPDLRNSKVADVVSGLADYGHRVTVHDPLADSREAAALYRIALAPRIPKDQKFDCVVGAVAHDEYRAFSPADLAALVKPGGLVADIKGLWRNLKLQDSIRRWEL
jgi:UDP-N-acetyl-D-galactosamine dehydrogenase